jgi:hypothetical protein
MTRTSGGAFSSLRVSCDDVLEFLAKGKVVSASQWRYEYSHVAFGDRTGRLTLRDRTVLLVAGAAGRPRLPGVAGRAQDIPRALLRGGALRHRSGRPPALTLHARTASSRAASGIVAGRAAGSPPL